MIVPACRHSLIPLCTHRRMFLVSVSFMTLQRGVGWRSVKRPGVDLFLYRMYRAGYEIVVFSKGQSTVSVCASLAFAHGTRHLPLRSLENPQCF